MPTPTEGFKAARLLMILSSLGPLFLLWAVRGIGCVPDKWLWAACAVMIVVPNAVLWIRVRLAQRRRDSKTLVVGHSDDNREHLLVYLFAMLIPLYDANLVSEREALAMVIAFVLIVFLFWHLNLHYMNLLFAIFGYRVFTIHPPTASDAHSPPFVLLTHRCRLREGDKITAYRISNSVFFEPKPAPTP